MTGLIFQPYGVIPGEYKAKSLDMNIVMRAWRPKLPQNERVRTFNKWRQDRLDEFVISLWPRFDFQQRQWVGPAKAFAEALTEIEIDAMIDAFMGPSTTLKATPTSPLAAQDIENHLEHYKYEDQAPNPPGVNYRQYDRTLTTAEDKDFKEIMIRAISAGRTIGEKSAGHFFFKNQMQRPRPLHAAIVFRREDDFVSELSQRGQHPSIVSGHCFQGTMMACAVLEQWMNSGSQPAPERVASLAQYMVDFGDRRVFAGVHYPTDNVASWVLAISLIPEVFENPQPILGFLRDAVTSRSTVFQLIRDQYTHSGNLQHTHTVIDLLNNYGLTVQPSA